MKRVLFVCTGNTCRSPMAELIFNTKAREKGIKAQAQSAGLCTIEGLPIHENSCEALKEIGIESDFFSSADIYDLDLGKFDLICGMTAEHIDELKSMGIPENKLRLLNADNGGVADPYGGNLSTYKLCRDTLIKNIEEIISEL
ncbi:MAG: low molecular weight protein arginine phosphatase [Clostridia bacterium]|nr:low molecular weight protein arginine phosphatase [Clostridia bacterium]